MIRIIVVEDDPMVAQLNAAYIGCMADFEVCGTFSNGLDALEYLRKNPVDLAVVDVYMPICSGMELLRKMRGSGIRTAVIMLTAATEMSVVEEALLLGIEDYIIKPFSYDRLRDTLLRYRDKTSLVQRSEKADQAVVDRLMGNQTIRERELPKGLNAMTMDSIRGHLEEQKDQNHTCESLSARTGLSKVTVRHYLNYLIDTGVLTSTIDYETGGRPRVLYRLK